jgi:nucleoside-diphosphate-sugar epimerase
MKILVTGATGFIGRRLLAKLNNQEKKIKVLSRKPYPGFDTVICDLHSNKIPNDALVGVDTVFHLAGFAHDLRDSNKLKNFYQSINVDATVELAKLALKNNVKKFVFISSVKAGKFSSNSICITETEQGIPRGIYGRTKREAELKLLEIGKNTKMQISIIRPALVYGPNVKGNLKLILLGVEQGWFPPLPEVGNKRSMIHVDDLVRAILFISDSDNINGEIFIATDGRAYSSRQIYNAMCKVAGKKAPKWSVPRFMFDILSLMSLRIRHKVDKLFDDEYYSSKKLEALGFKAEKTLENINETSF